VYTTSRVSRCLLDCNLPSTWSLWYYEGRTLFNTTQRMIPFARALARRSPLRIRKGHNVSAVEQRRRCEVRHNVEFLGGITKALALRCPGCINYTISRVRVRCSDNTSRRGFHTITKRRIILRVRVRCADNASRRGFHTITKCRIIFNIIILNMIIACLSGRAACSAAWSETARRNVRVKLRGRFAITPGQVTVTRCDPGAADGRSFVAGAGQKH
jgi:hypothetical protein